MLPEMQAAFDRHNIVVSRETIEKLSVYAQLLLKWQKAINLVGPTTLEDIYTRHFVDSAQVFQYINNPSTTKMADLGSGAGFPGMVLAIMGVKDVYLVESDVRKSTFLREVSRETKTPVTIHDIRIEDCQIPELTLITARALAPVKELLKYAMQLANGSNIQALLLKGANHEAEIEDAHKLWDFGITVLPSLTDNSGKILNINNLIKK